MQLLKSRFSVNAIVGLALVLTSIGIVCGFQTTPPLPPPPPLTDPLKCLPIPFMHKELVSLLIVIPDGKTIDWNNIDLGKIICTYSPPQSVSVTPPPNLPWNAIKIRRHKNPQYVTVVFLPRSYQKSPQPPGPNDPVVPMRILNNPPSGTGSVTVTVPTTDGGTLAQQYPVDDNVETN